VRFGGVISGTGRLVQMGTGTTTLTSAGNSVGTTAIRSGTLLINGSLASSTVTAGNGTTLGGTGSVSGVVTLASGATLAPGASAATTGVLTVGSLILNPGSILAYDLQTPNLIGPQNDRVDIHGNLTLAGTLNVTDTGSFASTPGSYRLINYTGTLTGAASDLQIGRTPGYTQGDVFVQTIVPGQVNLITVLKGLPVEYWDGSGVTGNGVISGGSVKWNNSAPNWVNANGTINQSWIPGMAIFTGAAGTVTLGENVSAMAMQFSTDGYQIAGNGHTITLLGMPNSHLSLIRVDPGSTATITASLVGQGGLNKADNGTLILSGDNTYTDGTVISGGTLQIGNGGTSGIISGNINNNGTVAFDRIDSVSFSGAIAGQGNLVQLGSGTLALVGNNAYSGGSTVNEGTLVAGSNNALGTGPVSVAGSSSTLQINSGVTLTNLISLHNGGTLNNSGTLNGGSSTLLVTLGGTIVNSAGGVITVNQIQLTQAPATLVNSGTIHANLEFANFANTVQLFTGSSVVGNLGLGTNPGTNLILDGTGTQSLKQAVTGTITNSGNLTKQGAGTWIIDEELDAPVSTNVLAGVLTVNNTLNSPYVTVQSGATLMGAGNISGSVTNFGSISPGNSPGTLTINGNYTQAQSGVFKAQIASATNYDRLAVTGRANLDGTLRLTLLSGYRPGLH
jgi:fibronectin-binding autotransporter adhesin